MKIRNLTSGLKDRFGIKTSTNGNQPSKSPDQTPPPSENVSAPSATAESPPPAQKQDRPYWRGNTPVVLPPRQIFKEIYKRLGKEGPVLLQAEDRDQLRQAQAKIDELNERIHQLNADGLYRAVKEARNRLRRGRGSSSDSAFSVQNELLARRRLKKEKAELIAKACPMLTIIGHCVEEVASRVLPQVEREARLLGVAPADAPLVRLVAAACWTPSVCARDTIFGPRAFLRQLAIKL